MTLHIKSLSKQFKGVTALRDVDMEACAGCITGIAGPNGAGKTTLLNVISGFLQPDNGDVHLGDKRISGIPPWKVARLGIGRLFQEVRPFSRMSVIENILVTIKSRAKHQLSGKKAELRQAGIFLKEVGLGEQAAMRAEELSYGQQKLLAIARLLAGDFQVLLLDEPTAGVHMSLVEKILDLISTLAQQGKTVLIIEHNLDALNAIANKVYFMANGEVLCEGPPREVLEKDEVRQAFLGEWSNGKNPIGQ